MTAQPLPSKLYYTTREAAAVLNCTPQHVRDLVDDGKLRANRELGRKILIPVDEIKRCAPDVVPSLEALSSAADRRDVVRELRRWLAEGQRLLAELEG